MYLENPKGTLEVITGPMFAGKTEELIKRVKILTIAKIKTLVIKPTYDTRFSFDNVVSRNGEYLKALNISKASEILKVQNDEYQVVAIDEVHFFDEEIIDVILKLIAKNIKVIVSGLDMDFARRPFGIMPHLLAIADEVVKLKAVCVVCHTTAGFSFRKLDSIEINLLGDDEYEARCRHCHEIGMKFKK